MLDAEIKAAVSVPFAADQHLFLLQRTPGFINTLQLVYASRVRGKNQRNLGVLLQLLQLRILPLRPGDGVG
ncbi:hypothetical protein D3C87_2170670 [compost metagenome]